uniref:Gustatory receptor n=1 Tax=Ditylenchus dipsaci TaxID=166011 RepID=A0A915DAF4_9BILA
MNMNMKATHIVHQKTIGANVLRTTFLSLAIERFFATAYSLDYETNRRFILLVIILLPVSYLFAFVWSISFLKYGLPYLVFVSFMTCLDILGTISCLMISRYNRKLRKFNLRTDIKLSQRYQIDENLRVLAIIRPLMISGVVFLSLSVWQRFILKVFVGGELGYFSRNLFYLLLEVYVALACFMLVKASKWRFKDRLFTLSQRIRHHPQSPISFANLIDGESSIVQPFRKHHITNVLGENIETDASFSDHFKMLEKFWDYK